ncbi:DUF6804 family protein [Flavobacterium sp.]|uniref:DUF6804 family protein n=1 Tax=Flavobacterium sp. TaxID=239 RepID=UPI002FD9A798
MNNLLKIILALLLFLCLFNMPYGYYQFVRFAAMGSFLWLGWEAHQQGKSIEVFVFLLLALLFQPFLKIALGRTIWNNVNAIVGVGLLISIKKTKS